jgi:predicted nuclease of predicted toxin-antitoxin system
VPFSIVVDMNLSPDWGPLLQLHGHSATHWSKIGDPKALDSDIMDWARNNGHIVLTHDLDFGTILAQTHATGPSVILIRADDTFPTAIGGAVISALEQCEADLRGGALIVIDPASRRVRILPI